MKKYKVIFNFDSGNTLALFIDGEDKESLLYHITGNKEWFFHEDEKGLFHSVNMKLVTSITVTDF